MTREEKLMKVHALLAEVSDVPVSYTHLDVYKRQIRNFPSGLKNILPKSEKLTD